MNTWQLCNEIRDVLRNTVWAGTSNQVFGTGAVLVTVGPEIEVGTAVRFPAAMIRPLDMASDPDHAQLPDLIRQRIGLRLFTMVAGDALGETPLIGGFWATAAADQTEGRGLLEIEEEIFNAIESLSLDDGIEIQFIVSGAAQAAIIEEIGYVVFRDYEFEAWVTASRDYPPAREFLATASTAGVSMTWANPATGRYDFRRMRLRRQAGTVAPGPTDGTALTLSSDTATSHTDTPGSGVFSYSIFAAYDDRQAPPATDREFSSGDSATVTVP